MRFDFGSLEGMVKGNLLGKMERNADAGPTSLIVYHCASGHQAVQVTKGPDNYGPLERVLPNGCCPVCVGQSGEMVEMS